MRRKIALLLALAVAAIVVPGVLQPAGASPAPKADLINFTNDLPGDKPNGWFSSGSSITKFSDSLGADLQVDDYGNQSKGNALGVFSDDQSFLKFQFSVPVCGLRLGFGNDDPSASRDGDRALLRVSNGPVTVGHVSMVMNRNDIMDQSIGFRGASFTDAAFWYAVTTSGLTEVVDNIAVIPC